jgi:hypothetical protein
VIPQSIVTPVFALFVCAFTGCQQREKPRQIRLELPELITSRDPVSVSVRVTNADGATQVSSEDNDFSLEPADLGSVTKRGFLTCQRSGDGKLAVNIAGVSSSSAVRCRLVDRLEAPDVGRVELTSGPFKPKVKAVDKRGTELPEIELSYFSKNSGVIFPKEGMLVPKAVGSATIVARSGSIAKEFKVDVVRRVVVEALPIAQNRRIHFSLDEGKYELVMKLPSPKRVRVEWPNAPYCNTTSESSEHVVTCVLRAKGGVEFDNPAYLADGSTNVSVDGVTLHEVPQ